MYNYEDAYACRICVGIPSNVEAANNKVLQATGSVKRELHIVTFSTMKPRTER